MSIGFIIFFDGPISKSGANKGKVSGLELYQQQVIQLHSFLFRKSHSFFFIYFPGFFFEHITIYCR